MHRPANCLFRHAFQDLFRHAFQQIKLLACFISTLSGSNLGSGITDHNGGNSVNGSHTSQFDSSFARSVIGSAIAPHSDGPGFPPKVSRRGKRRNSSVSFSILVSDWTAAVAFKCILLYAELQSSFLMRIHLVSAIRQQCTMWWRHLLCICWPYLLAANPSRLLLNLWTFRRDILGKIGHA